MKVIAETKDGCLVHATNDEVKEILTSVSGKRPEKIEIGQKIPAIDYASTITKIKSLRETYVFKELLAITERFYVLTKDLEKAVANANNIEA